MQRKKLEKSALSVEKYKLIKVNIKMHLIWPWCSYCVTPAGPEDSTLPLDLGLGCHALPVQLLPALRKVALALRPCALAAALPL